MKTKLLTLITTCTLGLSTISFADEAVKANNLLGEKLATAIVKTNEEQKNFMISGTSLQQALSLVANGTAGHTRDALENYLDTSIENLNEANVLLKNKIHFTQKQKEEMVESVRFANPAVITTANSIWRTTSLSEGEVYKFAPSFVENAKTFYGAEHFVLDFKAKPSVKAVNKWAEDNTNGLVKKILNAEEMQDMLWMVMNATYLEASWKKRFYNLTHNAPKFTLLDGKSISVDMMNSTQYVNYLKLADQSEMVAIKLNSDQEGTDLAFIAYLPNKLKNFKQAQIDFFQTEIHNFSLPELVGRVGMVNAKITMPKFSFDYSVKMKANKEITKKMGLNHLFMNNANFSRMATRESIASKVGLIKQNTKIELDEGGIKAAAVTVIGGIRATSVRPQPAMDIKLDRPFTFAIIDRNTQAVLFSGAVVNP